jgi:RNA polymerase sigma-70 factor (ECF subfamily)
MAQSPFDIEVDEVTLAQARRGHLPACERIFRSFQQPAYSVAFRICQCPQTAQDITQDAFITAFRKFRQYRGDAPLWGWLRRVVVNHAISSLRRQPARSEIELRDCHSAAESEQARIGLAMDLEAALAALGREDRAVVWLHDVEGYSHQEIAELFAKTESFSKTRLSRARAKLRQLLDSPHKDKATDAPNEQLASGTKR